MGILIFSWNVTWKYAYSSFQEIKPDKKVWKNHDSFEFQIFGTWSNPTHIGVCVLEYSYTVNDKGLRDYQSIKFQNFLFNI